MYASVPAITWGRLRQAVFAGQTRRNRKAGEPRATAGEVNQHICWFDVLVDEASLVHPPECRGERYCDAEELRRFQRSPGKPVERLAAGIFEHQHGPIAVAEELKGARRPRCV